MRRFLFFAIPLLVLTMGLFQFALDALGLQLDPRQLSPSGGVGLPAWIKLGTWGLEALGLASLYILIQGGGGREGGGCIAGLLAGWIAWVFRGPLLVVTVVGFTGLAPGPWWTLAFTWWVLYSLCGLLLGGVARAAGLTA